MSTDIIFMFAIGVFALMGTGIVLTMQEFKKINKEQTQRQRSGSGARRTHEVKATRPPQPARELENKKSRERANIRIVH